ncbi:glycosyltransferase family 4 protein [Pseudaeromonas sp. ZJS20]|uniref:glycosyltransferase family 4 protein n=1 Tax=Pseudaeromonas aegiceratis TaxID=3153928 RepID=UPI00390C5270
MNMLCGDVIILHDTGGQPYYEAIEHLKKKGDISSLVYLESSVFFLLARFIVKKNFNIKNLRRVINNLVFRVSLPFVKNKTIIMGMGPYDFRFFFYSLLAYKNTLIYQTSWPYWWSNNVPRRYWFFTSFAKNAIKYCIENRPFKVVCVSRAAYDTLCSQLSPAACKKVSIIPHCINTAVFKPGRKWGGEFRVNGKFNILFVGRLVKSKGIPLIVELISLAPPDLFCFTVVGDGPMLSFLKEKYEAATNVHITGPIRNKNDLASVYADADVLLVPSVRNKRWEELFGIVVIEGLSSGSVVIASNHVGPNEILDDGVTGFLVSDQVEACHYFRIINKLRSDKKLFSGLSNSATQASEKYSIETVSESWMQLLSN